MDKRRITSSLIFKGDRLFYLDQRLLPHREVYKECVNLQQGYRAIKRLEVRGAPLIGVFSAYCLYIGAKNIKVKSKRAFLRKFEGICNYLKRSRPTAVNLSWAVERIQKVVKENINRSIKEIKESIRKEAIRIHKEDIQLCRNMGKYGLSLIKEGDSILTHCNTGFLATSGDGTALAVIYAAARKYKGIKVYADETRPLLQGSRLTAWELIKRKINTTVICDNMAAYLLQQRKIDKIFVGADRIARNGDTANKIGTYNVAVLAKYHRIPFYVVAPFSTFDLSIATGKDIPIEQRNPDEVRIVLGKVKIAPSGAGVYNPAFDVTPHHLITAIVTDRGIIHPPFTKNIRAIIGKKDIINETRRRDGSRGKKTYP